MVTAYHCTPTPCIWPWTTCFLAFSKDARDQENAPLTVVEWLFERMNDRFSAVDLMSRAVETGRMIIVHFFLQRLGTAVLRESDQGPLFCATTRDPDDVKRTLYPFFRQRRWVIWIFCNFCAGRNVHGITGPCNMLC